MVWRSLDELSSECASAFQRKDHTIRTCKKIARRLRHIGVAVLPTWLALAAGAADLPRADAVFPAPNMDSVRLGQLLFYDPILSGNRKTSCASCHHPDLGTADSVSLGLGDGATGLGTRRTIDPGNVPEQRVPRNAPALFNLGAPEFTVMFHDGRLQADPDQPGGIRTPLGADMVSGFDSVLAAQAMFPVLSGDEMAGHGNENDISRLVRQGLLAQPGGAWDAIAARVASIPQYAAAFEALNGAEPITFTGIANALADFIAVEWRADASPFDQYLRGDTEALSPSAQDGMTLFYGKAGCADCHTGQFQTDHGFHAIAMPQIGPGKAARFESHHRDVGRMRVTGDPADAYHFRTPSLRNVDQTGPYGHSGAYATLEAVVRHHLDPIAALQDYNQAQAVLPDLPGAEDFLATRDAAERAAIAAANTLAPITLNDREVARILAFLHHLTDRRSPAFRLGIPAKVPSGLPVETSF